MKGRMPLPETRKLVLSVNDRNDIDVRLYDWLLVRGAVLLRSNSTQHAFSLMDRVQVDAVITDLRRKEGRIHNPTAGIELTRAIRQRGWSVPVIMYTLEVPEPLESLVHQAGVDRVTVDTAELYRWLERIGI